MDENKPLTTKELRELLGYVYNDLPTDDEELIKEARDTYLKFKRIHKNCIPKLKVNNLIKKAKQETAKEILGVINLKGYPYEYSDKLKGKTILVNVFCINAKDYKNIRRNYLKKKHLKS